MKIKYGFKKVSFLTMLAVLGTQSILPANSFALASDALVAMPLASYESTLDPVGKILAKAMEQAYSEASPQINNKVAALTKPRIETMHKALADTVNGNEGFWQGITYQAPTLEKIVAQIPPSPVLSMIPAAQLGLVKAQAQKEVETSIRSQFAATSSSVQESIQVEMDRLTPIVLAQVKPQIKLMINDLGDMIDQEISVGMENALELEIGNLINSLPEDKRKLGPEALAEMYAKKMMPVGEAMMRPQMEAEMKAIIANQVYEIIEAPMAQMIEERLSKVDVDGYKAIVDQIPESAFVLIPREFVRGIVDSELDMIKANIPNWMSAQKSTMKDAISKEIDAFIDHNTKVYVNNVMTNLPFKIKNSKLFIKSSDMFKTLQISMKYDNTKKTITLVKGKTIVVMTVGSDKIYVNGKLSSEKLSTALMPYMDGKSPMVPIEKVAPLFGMTADYNYDWNVLDLDKK